MTRRTCTICGFPINACVCAAVTKMHSRHQLVVLQHPSETGHAKNSARLLPLCLPQTKIYLGESANDFVSLRDWLAGEDRPVFLLYPAENAISVETLATQAPIPDAILLLLDGTWRKAYRMWQLNPWLQQLPALSFAQPPETGYTIRKASQANSLSTLEAAAHCLQYLDDCDVSPLLEVFQARIRGQLACMPDAVRERYGQKPR